MCEAAFSKNATRGFKSHRERKNLISFWEYTRHFNYMDVASLRKILSKLRECLDQRPTNSPHVRMVLNRKYRGEKTIRLWGDVFSQGILGTTGTGVVVLVSRKDVEKKAAELESLIRNPRKKPS